MIRFSSITWERKTVYNFHQNCPENEGYASFLKKLDVPLILKLSKNSKGFDFTCGSGSKMSTILKERGSTVFNYGPYYFPNNNLLKKNMLLLPAQTQQNIFTSQKKNFFFDILLKDDSSYLVLRHRCFLTKWTLVAGNTLKTQLMPLFTVLKLYYG